MKRVAPVVISLSDTWRYGYRGGWVAKGQIVEAPRNPERQSISLSSEAAEEEDALITRAADLLGGAGVLRRRLHRPLDAHEAVRQGLPREALSQLVGNVAMLRHPGGLERALGISLRSVQRFKAAPKQTLSTEQSGRAWKFAAILARATQALGSQEEAERWLETPAMALDRRRPIDLLATPAGAQLVDDLLGRIEYGVYT